MHHGKLPEREEEKDVYRVKPKTFKISISALAELHLKALPAREQRIIEAAVHARLSLQPSIPTKNIKRLRPNPLVKYELRVGDLRVLYNIEGDEVILLVIGRKIGNKLLVKGEEFHGHQDDPAKPAQSKPEKDT